MKPTSAKQKRTVKVRQAIQMVKKEMTDKHNTASGYQQALKEINSLGFDN